MPADPALAARLREATGPSRELDVAIAEALGLIPEGYERVPRSIDQWWPTTNIDLSDWWSPPRWTASVDAIDALTRAVLPGVRADILTSDGWANVQLRHGEIIGGTAAARTEPLARCLALVEWEIAHAVDR